MNKSLEIVVPVLNEERVLAASVGAIHHFLSGHLDSYEWRITIADNGSTDQTPEVARRLIDFYDRVGYTVLDRRGRGRALKKAWLDSNADMVAYMDVDLSTNLNDLIPLVGAIADEGYDLAIGSRLLNESLVEGRSRGREFTSRAYNMVIQASFFVGFRDAQCGFKAVSRRAADLLLPLIKDTGWFFDTELLIVAEKNGFRIKEIPVRWHDDPDTRVRVFSTAMHDLAGLARLRLGGLRGASARLRRSLRQDVQKAVILVLPQTQSSRLKTGPRGKALLLDVYRTPSYHAASYVSEKGRATGPREALSGTEAGGGIHRTWPMLFS